MGKIYDGTRRDHVVAVQACIGHNLGYLFKRPTVYTLPEITSEDVRTACKGARATAAGPDSWAPAEWRVLSDHATHRLAQLLRSIEDGGNWPTALTHATSAYLSKDPANATDPLACRVLSLLPVLYRRWSAIRLRHMQGWIEEWR